MSVQDSMAGLNFSSEDEANKFKTAISLKLQERINRRNGKSFCMDLDVCVSLCACVWLCLFSSEFGRVYLVIYLYGMCAHVQFCACLSVCLSFVSFFYSVCV